MIFIAKTEDKSTIFGLLPPGSYFKFHKDEDTVYVKGENYCARKLHNEQHLFKVTSMRKVIQVYIEKQKVVYDYSLPTAKKARGKA